jgi:hypothetical protein
MAAFAKLAARVIKDSFRKRLRDAATRLPWSRWRGWNTEQSWCVLYGQPSSITIKGVNMQSKTFGHCQCRRFDDGGHGCVGSKQYCREDARPHHAKDAPGEEHWTGGIRICARSPEAEVQVTISI